MNMDNKIENIDYSTFHMKQYKIFNQREKEIVKIMNIINPKEHRSKVINLIKIRNQELGYHDNIKKLTQKYSKIKNLDKNDYLKILMRIYYFLYLLNRYAGISSDITGTIDDVINIVNRYTSNILRSNNFDLNVRTMICICNSNYECHVINFD